MIFRIRDLDPNSLLIFRKNRTVFGKDYKSGDMVPQDFPLFLKLKLLKNGYIGIANPINTSKDALKEARKEVKEYIEEKKNQLIEEAVEAVSGKIVEVLSEEEDKPSRGRPKGRK